MLNVESLLLRIKNRRPVVILAPIVAGIIAGGMLVVRPGLTNLNDTKTELAGLQQKVSAYQFLLDSEKKMTDFKSQFSGDKTWLIEQINTIAEKTGISILSILPEDPKKVGDYLDRTSVRIDAESDFNQLGEFISRIESLDSYVKILSIDINAENSAAPAAPQGPWQQGTAARPGRPIQAMNVYEVSISVALFSPAAGAL